MDSSAQDAIAAIIEKLGTLIDYTGPVEEDCRCIHCTRNETLIDVIDSLRRVADLVY